MTSHAVPLLLWCFKKFTKKL